ncbi:MAG: hypothetical protein H0W30_18540 [Gemmatimonadaceae bacterium]|nr:hypothetical protein [Gemmatimonadaceae bacterium]
MIPFNFSITVHASRLRAKSLAILVTLAVNASALPAQAVLGIGEDATTVRRGTVRFSLATSSTRFDSRYGSSPGDRSAVPLGLPLTFDSIGVAQLPSLLPLRSALRQLTGISTLDVNLGRSNTRIDATIHTFPLGVELGVTDRLSIGMLVPIVRTRAEVSFNTALDRNGANLGLNPAFGNEVLRDQNDVLFAQLGAAGDALSARISECQSTPSGSNCGIILQRGPAELANTALLLSGLVEVYEISAFVPTTGSAADVSIRSNVQALAATYTDVLGLRDSQNQPLISSAGPASARTIPGASALNAILTDPDIGFGTEPIATTVRTGIGDIEVGAKLQVINTLSEQQRLISPGGFHFRSALSGVARLGTGTPDSPDNLVDIGTGDGQTDIEARSQSDLVFGRKFWLSVVGRYGWQLSGQTVLRITDVTSPLVAAFGRGEVERDPGDYAELEITPRFVFNEFFSVSGQYKYRRKEQDRHTGQFSSTDAVGDSVTIRPTILDANTEQRESRISAGISYSTVAAHRRGRVRYPLEVFVQHVESISGSGANVPKIRQQIVQLRLYMRIFGKR